MRQSLLNRFFSHFGFQVLKNNWKIETVNLKEIRALRQVFGYFSYLLIIWGLYRLIFRFPEEFEELFLKPLLWLGPLLWLILIVDKQPLSSLGLNRKNLKESLVWGLGLGLFFALEAVLANIIKFGEIKISDEILEQTNHLGFFLIPLVTAIVEELAFRGFIFNWLYRFWKNEWQANLVTSALFLIIYLPITIFVLQYQFSQILLFALIVFFYSLGANFVMGKTNNLAGPVLLHFLWYWPLLLFG